jgi:hypothetical protein
VASPPRGGHRLPHRVPRRPRGRRRHHHLEPLQLPRRDHRAGARDQPDHRAFLPRERRKDLAVGCFRCPRARELRPSRRRRTRVRALPCVARVQRSDASYGGPGRRSRHPLLVGEDDAINRFNAAEAINRYKVMHFRVCRPSWRR